MDNYKFKDKLDEGMGFELELDKIFSHEFDIKSVDISKQRLGIDRYFTRKSNGASFTVEYKSDSTAASTGNVFIEIVSVDTTNRPGWAKSSQADILIYYIPPAQKIIITRMEVVKKSVPIWENTYKQQPVPNEGYKTIGILVPIGELIKLSIPNFYTPDKANAPISNNRDSLIRKLSQCHLNPGWNVTRQTELFNKYGIFTVDSWNNLTTEQLKQMATEAI
jgi:hypothetical protein